MSASSVGIAWALLLSVPVALPTGAEAAQRKDKAIIVKSVEPVHAANARLSVVGTCEGHEVTIAYIPKKATTGIDGVVEVRSGRSRKVFDRAEQFVREAFLIRNSISGMDIFCNRDRTNTFFLHVWGATLKSKDGPMALWTARIDFASDGSVLRYGGIMDRSYSEFFVE